jgi:8-hydroxy-5-deazaflavin:NADPH oxidoreductase
MKRESSNHPIIAVLGGTGKEGPGLAMRWASAGYQVIIGSREAEKAQTTARELNEKLGTNLVSGMQNPDAASKADISVLTVVQEAHQAALESLKDSLAGKILVDTTARVDFRNPVPPNPPAAGRTAQEILGSRTRVVAAFQTVPAHSLKKNLGESLEVDVLVCADDLSAAESVIKLAEAAGMSAFYAGGLDNALAVESITALLISINKHYGSRTASLRVAGVNKP